MGMTRVSNPGEHHAREEEAELSVEVQSVRQDDRKQEGCGQTKAQAEIETHRLDETDQGTGSSEEGGESQEGHCDHQEEDAFAGDVGPKEEEVEVRECSRP
jgi:hypothetical protein